MNLAPQKSVGCSAEFESQSTSLSLFVADLPSNVASVETAPMDFLAGPIATWNAREFIEVGVVWC